MSSTAPGPKLPTELIDLITDFAFEDRKTVEALSLTARSCVARTRDHLFRWKTIDSLGLSPLLSLLDNPVSTIGRSLRELTLNDVKWTSNNHSYFESPVPAHFTISGTQFTSIPTLFTTCPSSLTAVLAQLQVLRVLHLRNMYLPSSETESTGSESTSTPLLTSRHIDTLIVE